MVKFETLDVALLGSGEVVFFQDLEVGYVGYTHGTLTIGVDKTPWVVVDDEGDLWAYDKPQPYILYDHPEYCLWQGKVVWKRGK